jgi:hypothetical protein
MALCFLLLFTTQNFAENRMDTIINTHIISIDPLNKASISDNQVAFISAKSWNMDKRKLEINKLNLKNLELIKLSIEIPTSLKILQCPAICMTDSFFLIQDEFKLNWFLFKNVNNQYKLIEQIPLPPHTMAFDARALNEHQFLLTDIYNHHPMDSVKNTTLLIYDARIRKFIAELHPDIPCIGLSHFPQNWISQNETFIALAEPCGSTIRLYDLKLKPIRSIKLPESRNWKNLYGNKLPIETSPAFIDPKSLIEKLSPILSIFSRIETIHFANDSLLLISCSLPDSTRFEKENFVYNINSNVFLQASSVSIARNYENSDRIESAQTFQITPDQLIRNGICISLEEDNFIPDPTLTTIENEINKDKFYEDHDPEFIIRISSIIIQ